MKYIKALGAVVVIMILYAQIDKHDQANIKKDKKPIDLTKAIKPQAYTMATHLIKQDLKYPSSAKFSPITKSMIIELEPGKIFTVTSSFEASNDYGRSQLRHYDMTIQYIPQCQEPNSPRCWSIKNLSFLD